MGIEFEYKIYKEIKNDIMLSPDTLQMLGEFREYVENIDFFDKDILKTKYSVIQGKIISEIREAGNSKAIHTRKELECVFECIYVLARHFGKKQVEIIDIFNLRANDFAKLGIFPIRSYEAYSQPIRFRLLPKGWGHRESSSIADLINKTVLSPYVCSGVVVLSNDAELYANLYHSGKNCHFILPLSLEDISRANRCYSSQWLYASNTLIKGGAFGRVKKCIISLLKIECQTISDSLFESLISQGDCLSGFVYGTGTMEYEIYKSEYEKAKNNIDILNQLINGEGYLTGEEDIRFEQLPDGDDEEFPARCEVLLKEFVVEKEEALSKLKGVVNLDKVLKHKSDISFYKAWISDIRQQLSSVNVLEINDIDVKVLQAARFYVDLAFCEKEFNEQNINELLDWLKHKDLLECIDRIGRENRPCYVDTCLDSASLLSSVILQYFSKDKNDAPVLLFIDSDEYKIQQAELTTLIKGYRAIVVVKGCNYDGLSVLNEDLQLYSNWRDY